MLSIILACLTVLFFMLYLIKLQQVKILEKKLSDQNGQDEISIELENQADEQDPKSIDILTGLPNYLAFEKRFEKVLNYSKRFKMKFGVVVIDIEMSKINKLGYDVGDKVLKIFPQRILGCVRQIDTLTRYTGDKFILLLPQISKPATIAFIAQRIQEDVMQPFKIDDHEISINLFMGITIFPIDGDSFETLINRACIAMSQAKENIKNKYQFYSAEIQAISNRESELLSYFNSDNIIKDLRIENSSFIEVNKNKVICVEAIPKLIHPEFGLISDAEFSRLLDKSGKFWQITEFLIRTSFLEFKKLEMKGESPEKLIINVPLTKIEKTDFISAIINLLNEIKINPNQLILQFDKESISINTNSLESSLSMLDKSGINVAISILALGKFSAHTTSHISLSYLKIEKELIDSLLSNKDSNSVVDRIITLANNSNIAVIAEGIETEQQKNHLKELGCGIMNGKLFDDVTSEQEKTIL